MRTMEARVEVMSGQLCHCNCPSTITSPLVEGKDHQEGGSTGSDRSYTTPPVAKEEDVIDCTKDDMPDLEDAIVPLPIPPRGQL